MMWWQSYQLDQMQIICTSCQIDNDASNPPLNFFTGQMLNQQCESTEDNFKLFMVNVYNH